MKSIVLSAIEDLSDEVKKHVQVVGDPVKGYWDAKAFRRAIENLVSNAVKYGDEEKPIRVMVSAVLGRVILAVHNEGKAIPIQDRTLLFNSFHRTGEAKKSDKHGWGLGLAFVVKWLKPTGVVSRSKALLNMEPPLLSMFP